MNCLSCNGTKEIHGFGCPGFKPITMPCPLCKGTGEISEEQSQWISHGKKLREARIALRRTLREEARLRGVGMAEWSDIEFGRVFNLDRELPK